MGAGYSGLRQITTVRPTYLKLDRSLISGIDSDPDRGALVTALLGYARQTGGHLVAEGVETEAELAHAHASSASSSSRATCLGPSRLRRGRRSVRTARPRSAGPGPPAISLPSRAKREPRGPDGSGGGRRDRGRTRAERYAARFARPGFGPRARTALPSAVLRGCRWPSSRPAGTAWPSAPAA